MHVTLIQITFAEDSQVKTHSVNEGIEQTV